MLQETQEKEKQLLAINSFEDKGLSQLENIEEEEQQFDDDDLKGDCMVTTEIYEHVYL